MSSMYYSVFRLWHLRCV